MLRSRLIWIASLLFPALLLPRPVRCETPEDVVRSFTDQKLILRGLGDQKRISVKEKDLATISGTCDLAVQVTQAVWNEDRALFTLVEIGTPSLANRPRACKRTSAYGDGTLEISGFKGDVPAEELKAAIGQVLQTPEQYMTAMGVSLNIPRNVSSAANDAGRIPEGMSPSESGPKVVLSINPAYSKAARQAKYQGEVVVTVVVGPDGRAHNFKVARTLGLGLDESVTNVLPLWRFEPARMNDKAVGVQLTLELAFHLY